ncbi:F0F1 ATP synthase subunit B family protein [Actibacterium sp. D379-3]
MTFDWVTFGLQLVNVLVLLAILRHFLFRPVAGIIAKRQAATRAALADAEAAKAQAKTATAAAQTAIAATEAARHKVLTDAQAEAEAQRKDLLDAARAEAARIVADARAEAAQATQAAEAATLARARDLAGAIAQRALSALPAPPTVAGFADRLAAALAALPEDGRHALITGGGLRLVAPHPLSPDDLDTARRALAPFGIDAAPAETDPALIAGLELRSESGVVHNSLAHDLNRIAKALNDDDGSRP